MKRFKKAMMIFISVLGLVYVLGIFFYQNRFQMNTLYAGSNISHLTSSEAKVLIQKDLSTKQLTLLENGKSIGQIALSQLYPAFDPTAELEGALAKQRPVLWGSALVNAQAISSDVLRKPSIEQDRLQKVLDEMALSNDERTASQNAALVYNEVEGYYLEAEALGTQLDLEAFQKGLLEAVQTNQSSLDINQFYQQPAITLADDDLSEQMAHIKALSETEITYTMAGEAVTIPQVEIENWIYYDEAGDVSLDEANVYAYIESLDSQYGSLHQYREFQSTLQGVVTIAPQIYGWTFDIDTEVAALMAEIYAGEAVTRQPHYTGNVYTNDISQKDDIGKSHVEIDLGHQMLYVYLDGELALSTEVVTGMPPLMETIPGAWHILYKETDAVLKGFNPHRQTNYETPVNYWLPFDWEGMGIHDASWQGTFGGDVWTYAGSNGCINIPSSVMPALFALVETGMPVIIF